MKAKSTKARKVMNRANLSLASLAKGAKDPVAIIMGMIIGKFGFDVLIKALTKVSTVAGLKGTDGNGKDYLSALLLAVMGIVGKYKFNNSVLKNISMGVATYGGAAVLNTAASSIPMLKLFGDGAAATPTTTATAAATAGLGIIPRRTLPITAPAGNGGSNVIL